MIWLSALLVFGTVGLILLNLGDQGPALRPAFEQMIHARIPWLLLALLWAGASLGIAAVWRRRSRPRLLTLACELPLVALVSWYFLVFSFLPARSLAVQPGDAFPAYALLDQDSQLRRFEPASARAPALYVFYRGDW